MSSVVAKITVGFAVAVTTASAAPLHRVARGFQGQLEYQKLGHGYCRTPDGGKGDFDLLWYGNEWQCRDKCSSTNSCVGYEYQQHKNMCEIHKATVSHVDSPGHSGHGVVCFKKKQQPQPDSCSSDVMECWDGSFVSRDPHNNCEFESCPAQPVICHGRDHFDIGYGSCSTYGRGTVNHGYCAADGANDRCSECGKCQDKSTGGSFEDLGKGSCVTEFDNEPNIHRVEMDVELDTCKQYCQDYASRFVEPGDDDAERSCVGIVYRPRSRACTLLAPGEGLRRGNGEPGAMCFKYLQ